MKYLRFTRRGLLCFSSPDKGGPSGSAANAAEAAANREGGAAPLAASPAEPTGDSVEAKLESSRKISADYHRQLSGAMSERDTEVTEHGKTKAALQKEKDDHAATRAELDKETAAHTATKDQLRGATERADKADARVTKLEGLCKLQGIDPDKAVDTAAATEAPGELPAKVKQWKELKGAAKTKFYRANKAELDAWADANARK